MRVTCAQCGQEIVGAVAREGFDRETSTLRCSTVPEVFDAHNSLCSIVYGTDQEVAHDE
jgi:hypothetical protein